MGGAGPTVGGMSRIDRIFASLRDQSIQGEQASAGGQGGRALMPFVCGGHPGPGSTGELLLRLQSAGASIVEVGIPFSDPIADGPVIAAAMHEALRQGATPRTVFDEVAAVRERLSIGVVAMVSVSIVHRAGGIDRFVQLASDAGFDGFIFPDAPLEEAGEYVAAARNAGKSVSLMISPTTGPARMAAIAKACSGFVYLMARVGITGEQKQSPEVAAGVKAVRAATNLPIACGFGISTAEHVRAVVQHADAAIVGTALVRRIDQASREGRDPLDEAERFTRELVQGLSGPSAG